MYYLGIDGGTESVRAAIFDAAGALVGSASAAYSTQFPQPAWAEQSPDEWWERFGEATRAALADADVDPSSVAGVCVDTTNCTVVALDEGGEALRPALLWMDVRSGEEAAQVAACGGPELVVNGGGAGPVSAEWMLPKALWLKRHEPDVFARARYVCEYQDYVMFRMTGRMCASRNNVTVRWHYAESRGWPVGLLRKLGLEELVDKFPSEVLPVGALVGGVSEPAARHLGLAAGTPVVQGGIDAHTGILGLGVCRDGEMAMLTGSSHLHLGLSSAPLHGKGMFGSYEEALIPGLHIVEGGQTSTGSVVAWCARLLGGASYEELDSEVEGIAPGAEGLVALDHFQGCRTPYTDSLSRGALVGLTLRHTRAHVFRAVMESVCYGTRQVLETMARNGYRPRSIRAAGGPTKSALWMQMHADVLGLPIVLTRVADAPALGAAVIAAVGTGRFPDFRSAIEAMVHVKKTYSPDAARHEQYSSPYKTYKELYPALAPIYHRRA